MRGEEEEEKTNHPYVWCDVQDLGCVREEGHALACDVLFLCLVGKRGAEADMLLHALEGLGVVCKVLLKGLGEGRVCDVWGHERGVHGAREVDRGTHRRGWGLYRPR